MRNKLLTIFLVFYGLQCSAQFTTNSPYSTYGLGERGSTDNAVFTGIGNASITYFDSTLVNFYNPATYNTLGEGQPVFSIGVNARLSNYSQNSEKIQRSTAMLDHFAMGFTLKKHFGLAFGLKPYARKGYSIKETEYIGTDSLRNTYMGTGGINQFFLGLSTNILKLKSTTLSIGSNLSYLFGTSTDERRSQLLDANPTDGGIGWHSLKVNSFNYTIAAYFRQSLLKKHNFTVAAVIEPSQKLRGTYNEYLFYGVVGNPKAYDTLYSSGDLKGTVNIPANISIGFSYSLWFNDVKNLNKVRNSELAFHVNYTTADWSKFSSSFSLNPYRLTATTLSFGVQYVPERKFLENASTSKFFEKVRYRLGYYQSTLPYVINDQQIKDQAATIGFGFPILSQNSLSSIQLALAYGKRTSAAEGSFNEQYTSISVGIILAPAAFERWFRKKKLD